MTLASVGIALGVENGKLLVVGLIPDAAADRSEEVFVGDEVIGVNGKLVHTLSLGKASHSSPCSYLLDCCLLNGMRFAQC